MSETLPNVRIVAPQLFALPSTPANQVDEQSTVPKAGLEKSLAIELHQVNVCWSGYFYFGGCHATCRPFFSHLSIDRRSRSRRSNRDCTVSVGAPCSRSDDQGGTGHLGLC